MNQYSKTPNGHQLSVPAQARQHAPAAVAELVRIIENSRSEAARLAAINILVDRGLGKPPKTLDIAIKDRAKPTPPMSDEEAREIYRRFRLNPWPMVGRDDANLEAFPDHAVASPNALGEN